MSHDIVRIPVPGTDRALDAALIDGKPFVALKPLCEALGIDHKNQREKLKARSWATGVLSTSVAEDGKPREMFMIDRRTMTMWLATLDENRVNEESRPLVQKFQAEAADALDSYFNDGPDAELSPFDFMRYQIDRMELAQRTADEALRVGQGNSARLDAIEGNHDWSTALGFAKFHKIADTSEQTLRNVGARASFLAKPHGIAPVKVKHFRYGTQNSYPDWLWMEAFQDLGLM